MRRVHSFLISLPVAACLAACVGAPEVQETSVAVGEDVVRLSYFPDAGVWRVNATGENRPLRGGELDLVREAIATGLDPRVCPPGEGLDFQVGRKITILRFEEVNYFPDANRFWIVAGCSPKAGG